MTVQLSRVVFFVRRARDRLLNLNTGKIDHNSIELTKKAFFALTNIYASKHTACCLHYPAFRLSKYQTADKLHKCNWPSVVKFLIFSFFLPLARVPNNRFLGWIFNFSLVFTGISLCLPFIQNAARAIVVCIRCGQNAIPVDATWEEKKVGKSATTRSTDLIHFEIREKSLSHCIYHKNFPLHFVAKHNFGQARGKKKAVKQQHVKKMQWNMFLSLTALSAPRTVIFVLISVCHPRFNRAFIFHISNYNQLV